MLVIKLQNNLVYNVFEDNNIFPLFENYSKCRFDTIISKYEEMKQDLINSSYISNYYMNINAYIKNNILKEIIKNSSSVSISYIAETIKEDIELVKFWVCENIISGLPARLDDIDNIVYFRNTNKMTETINKTLDHCNWNYLNSVNKIISNISTRFPKLKEEDVVDKQVIHLDKKFDRGYSGSSMDY
jgi:hypothetical protein